jgi:hypothetical protein
MTEMSARVQRGEEKALQVYLTGVPRDTAIKDTLRGSDKSFIPETKTIRNHGDKAPASNSVRLDPVACLFVTVRITVGPIRETRYYLDITLG